MAKDALKEFRDYLGAPEDTEPPPPRLRKLNDPSASSDTYHGGIGVPRQMTQTSGGDKPPQ